MYKVKKAFTDRESGMSHAVGDTYSGTEERVAELQEGGYLTKTEIAAPEPDEPGDESAGTRRKK